MKNPYETNPELIKRLKEMTQYSLDMDVAELAREARLEIERLNKVIQVLNSQLPE